MNLVLSSANLVACFNLFQLACQDEKRLTSRETASQRYARIKSAETRTIRKLCGWNVFQRSRQQGQALSGDEWRSRIKDISKEWRSMSAEEKRPWEVEAQIQQSKLDRLASTPLMTAEERSDPTAAAAADSEDPVWRNAAKKLSCRRLALNKASFNSHSVWDLPTQFGDGGLAEPVVTQKVRPGSGLSVVAAC